MVVSDGLLGVVRVGGGKQNITVRDSRLIETEVVGPSPLIDTVISRNDTHFANFPREFESMM